MISYIDNITQAVYDMLYCKFKQSYIDCFKRNNIRNYEDEISNTSYNIELNNKTLSLSLLDFWHDLSSLKEKDIYNKYIDLIKNNM